MQLRMVSGGVAAVTAAHEAAILTGLRR